MMDLFLFLAALGTWSCRYRSEVSKDSRWIRFVTRTMVHAEKIHARKRYIDDEWDMTAFCGDGTFV